MRKFNKNKYLISTAVAAIALSTGGAAQDQGSVDEELQLEEIIVTAGRRSQSLQDVPASVVAITPMGIFRKIVTKNTA